MFLLKMERNLKVSNVVVTGKIPLKKQLDYKKIIQKSRWLWQINNEEMSPILSVRFIKKGDNVHKKRKSAYVSIRHSGAINIVGVLSMKEALKK